MNSVIKATDFNKNENTILIDTRWNMKEKDFGKKEYEKGHIKDAIYLDFEIYLTDEVTKYGGRHPMPNFEKFKTNMENLGISDTSDIVIYDDGTLNAASRLWVMLKVIGLNSKIIEGGYEKLKELGLEISTVETKLEKGTINTKFNLELIVDRDYVINKFEDKDTILIDSRAPERYNGETEPLDKIAGHIPTAVNYFFKDNYNENILKSEDELKERFKELYDYKEVIVYCGSGVTGANNMLGIERAGINAKLYAGSFSDYISYEDSKVITNN